MSFFKERPAAIEALNFDEILTMAMSGEGGVAAIILMPLPLPDDDKRKPEDDMPGGAIAGCVSALVITTVALVFLLIAINVPRLAEWIYKAIFP